MAYTGYHFWIGNMELPYAPSELNITIGSNNETIELINGNEINILKNPKLTEIEFEIELPRGRQYPFANKLVSCKNYLDYFEKLMLTKTPVALVITRPNPTKRIYVKNAVSNNRAQQDFENTVFKKVSLEGYTLKESAENAFDTTVSLQFKEYISYGTVKKPGGIDFEGIIPKKEVTVETAPKTVEETDTYTVKEGDCLWNISKQFYGTGTKWKMIYNENKNTIEDAAKEHGRLSSSNGWWIYPGTKLRIPPDKPSVLQLVKGLKR